MPDDKRRTMQRRSPGFSRRSIASGLERVFGWRLSAFYQHCRVYVRRWRSRLVPYIRPWLEQLRRDPYRVWLRETDRLRAQIGSSGFEATPSQPVLSIVLFVQDPNRKWLDETITSAVRQSSPDWELWLCSVGDAETTLAACEQYTAQDLQIQKDPRIHIGPLLSAPNRALAFDAAFPRTQGKFIGLLDQHDQLAAHACAQVLRHFNANNHDLIYTDEDRLDTRGQRYRPFFKPDWSPDLCLSSLYACRFAVYRRNLIEQANGFCQPAGMLGETCVAYDLLLRCVEQSARVGHIAQVLYHQRDKGEGETRLRHVRAKRTLEVALNRRAEDASVEDGPVPSTFRVRRRLFCSPVVSIIIPTRDQAGFLRRCVQSIESKTTYPAYEILIVDNGSQAQETLAYLATLSHNVMRGDMSDAPFNFARVCNQAATQARGEQVLFLNNDMQVITPEWLEALLEHAQRPEVGAVGAQLLYADQALQHAGVVLGVRDIASHAHKYQPLSRLGYHAFPHIIRNYSAVTAACLMMRKAVYEEVGGMNEDLAVSFNDVDLCLRLQQQGYHIVYTPYAQLYHYESKSRRYQPPRPEEVQYMLDHWGAAIANDPYYNPHLALDREDFSFDIKRARAWMRKQEKA